MPQHTSKAMGDELLKAAEALDTGSSAGTAAAAVSGVLLLKWADVSKARGCLRERWELWEARVWPQIVETTPKQLGGLLNAELRRLLDGNASTNGLFSGLDYQRDYRGVRLGELVTVIDDLAPEDSDVWTDGTLGRAYNRFLGRLTERAGAKTLAEFVTPRSVNELIVRLGDLRERVSVYDPFAGSGGILAQAVELIQDMGHGVRQVDIAGQELNHATFSLAATNLLLHGTEPDIRVGDTLSAPQHTRPGGHLRTYDRVLTNPPFSMRYRQEDVALSEQRMRYGWSPQGHADLMLLQHALASVSPEGRAVVVLPHGPLFRATERDLRRGLVEDGRIEAVIGIGANVFYGTGLPACLIVLRGRDRPPLLPEGRVLFVDAAQEVTTGRTQNRLEPRHIEKIARVCERGVEVAGFSRAVPPAEIAERDFNLNIGWYVQPPWEAGGLLDVQAALYGGVPRSEVEANTGLFHAFGMDPVSLFADRDETYLDFRSEGLNRTAEEIWERSEATAAEFDSRIQRMWHDVGSDLHEKAQGGRVLAARSELLERFLAHLRPHAPLDEYELCGAFADWWAENVETLQRLGGISASAEADRCLDGLKQSLRAHLTKVLSARRRQLVATFHKLGDRYAVSLSELQRRSEEASTRMNDRLAQLGFRHPVD
ncbi:N-6 DNA methylase [Halostreptopolyspora alba]|uniref:site-specific DNA-methyltransferase (adenine-specific) n=1 Tax=Halostreptopolyspora alba TaxID=2487137 RepID=A0A3N0EI13_9ACTN|nr:hypothetical protein EFW17_01580 [Nocardiopsaceae bacterium YIM 96095]